MDGERIVMHPIRAEINGKPLEDFKDAKGNMFLLELAKECIKKGEGIKTYYWLKPGSKKPELKVSYGRYIPELN